MLLAHISSRLNEIKPLHEWMDGCADRLRSMQQLPDDHLLAEANLMLYELGDVTNRGYTSLSRVTSECRMARPMIRIDEQDYI